MYNTGYTWNTTAIDICPNNSNVQEYYKWQLVLTANPQIHGWIWIGLNILMGSLA